MARGLRSISKLVELYPGTVKDLAKRLEVSRQALYQLADGTHARCPSALLERLAEVLQETGLSDGTRPPPTTDVLAAWHSQRRAEGRRV